LQPLEGDGFDPRLRLAFLPSVDDEGLVRGDVLHDGEEA
jgi:hypothetical protein